MLLRTLLFPFVAALAFTVPPACAAAPEFGANLQYDLVDPQSSDRDTASGWRRRRLGAAWQLREGIDLKLEYDFAAGAWTDAHLRLASPAGRWRIGQFKQPFSLETLASDRNSLLMESAFARTFGIDRRLGAGLEHERGDWTVHASLFGQNLDGRNPGSGAALRAVWTPLHDQRSVLHLGGALAHERPDAAVSFSVRPEAPFNVPTLLASGSIDAARIGRAGLEAAWRRGPLLLQGEAARLDADAGAAAADGLDARGGYLSLGWMLTGETRGYKDTVFQGPSPARGWGAVEAAVRASRIEFDRDGRSSGQDALTVGLTWYLGSHLRVMANHVRASGRGDAAGLVDPRLLEVRVQLGF